MKLPRPTLSFDCWEDLNEYLEERAREAEGEAQAADEEWTERVQDD